MTLSILLFTESTQVCFSFTGTQFVLSGHLLQQEQEAVTDKGGKFFSLVSICTWNGQQYFHMQWLWGHYPFGFCDVFSDSVVAVHRSLKARVFISLVFKLRSLACTQSKALLSSGPAWANSLQLTSFKGLAARLVVPRSAQPQSCISDCVSLCVSLARDPGLNSATVWCC